MPVQVEQKPRIQNEVVSSFPLTVEAMEKTFQQAKSEAIAKIQQIISIAPEKRNFENTVREYDRAFANFNIPCAVISTLQMVLPDEALRNKAEETIKAFNAAAIDLFESNKDIYQVIKHYHNTSKEKLNGERTEYLTNYLSAGHRAGLDLEEQAFKQMIEFKKKIDLLSIEFSTNIANDKSALPVTREGLSGIDEDFIQSLKQEGDRYILLCDYPTRAQVMENCSVESTRRDYRQVSNNRAFPQNLTLLMELINCRDELAHLLGNNSFADLDIAPEMAKTSGRVEKFLDELFPKAAAKAKNEWALLLQNLPESVTLTSDGKVKPWDEAYLSNQYVKKHLNVDHEKIAEYFPFETAVQGLLSVFGKFLNLEFQFIPGQTFWDPSVQLIEVRQKGTLIGHLLLDLFPRESKFSHACCNSLVPRMSLDEGKSYQPALAIIIANFSKSTATKPSLLKHSELETLFHEFGHAMHALLGIAEMPKKAAYHTTMDFVEMPSQLFEEWIWDSKILKLISRHYQTGKPLPDDLIESLVKTKDFDEGRFLTRQVSLARTSLNCFKPGKNKDLVQLQKEIYDTGFKMVSYDPENHFLCSFGHLTDYGAKYYSYLWSKELAKKFIAYINTHGGPLDAAVGQRYTSKVIGKGGSCDPNILITDFLTEEPKK